MIKAKTVGSRSGALHFARAQSRRVGVVSALAGSGWLAVPRLALEIGAHA